MASCAGAIENAESYSSSHLADADIARAERAKGAQLCATESEAHAWRLKCLEAQAQLRLLKQERRGDFHSRWPKTDLELESIYDECGELQTDMSKIEAAMAKPLRQLVATRVSAQNLQRELDFEENQASRFEDMLAQEARLKTDTFECQESVKLERDDRYEALQIRLSKATAEMAISHELVEDYRRKRKDLDAHDDRQESNRVQIATIRVDCERFAMEAEDGRPRLDELSKECTKAVHDADRARAAAHRRQEAATALEEEIAQASSRSEEEYMRVEKELESGRAELQEFNDRTQSLDESARRVRYGHSQQVKAVRDDEKALRAALQDSAVEHSGIEQQVIEHRATVDDLSTGFHERKAKEKRVTSVVDTLSEDIRELAHRHSELLHQRRAGEERLQATQAELKALGSETESMLQTQQWESDAAKDGDACAAELRAEIGRVGEEFGADACAQRGELIASWEAEVCKLNEESAVLRTALDQSKERTSLRQQRLVQRQLMTKRAVFEAASFLKNGYSDLARDLRSTRSRGPRHRLDLASHLPAGAA
eukprot:TRINITY_DN76334_c0_g1_i2.p1 TRINITY_DN76334_c0_g1~~TRINITY_DN76334_c0_g1_i2.p1  ORF type:complete len:543 (+),score=94.54 TRINITY_DN76334_c0_g1_i2:61-1689(+)